MPEKLNKKDAPYLQKCLELAEVAVNAGDEAFGSILVNEAGDIIAESRNRVNKKTVLAHPEIDLAYWAAENLSTEERSKTTMYTTGEHCPMCAAAHGLVGLGTLVYLSSAKQLAEWQKEFDIPPAKINFLPVEEIIKNIEIRGPAQNDLLQEIKTLHFKSWQKTAE